MYSARKSEEEKTGLALVNEVLDQLELTNIITEMGELDGASYGRGTQSLRNPFDLSVANAVIEEKFDPVTLLELGPGGLKQALTITAELMKRNISVNWIFIDESPVVDDEFNGMTASSEKYNAFNACVDALKDKLSTDATCKVVGRFCSCLGYYLYIQSIKQLQSNASPSTIFRDFGRSEVARSKLITVFNQGCSAVPATGEGFVEHDCKNVASKDQLKPDMVLSFAWSGHNASEVILRAHEYTDEKPLIKIRATTTSCTISVTKETGSDLVDSLAP